MWKFNSNIYLQIIVLHVGIRWTSNMLSWQNALTCVRCQSCNPFRWTRVTRVMRVTQTLGSRLPHCFLLVVSLIFPQCHLKISVCILPRVCSPHSAFCTQPVFYSQSAVCILPLVRSPQSAFYTDRISNDFDKRCISQPKAQLTNQPWITQNNLVSSSISLGTSSRKRQLKTSQDDTKPCQLQLSVSKFPDAA